MSLHVRPLTISVDVHLDNTVLDSGLDLFLGRSRSSVEDEVDRERVLRLELLVSVLLVLREELGFELDVSDSLRSDRGRTHLTMFTVKQRCYSKSS